MPSYMNLQSILNAALGEYQPKGFRLMEIDDHALRLYYRDAEVGIFSTGGVTIPVIHETCREYLEKLDAS